MAPAPTGLDHRGHWRCLRSGDGDPHRPLQLLPGRLVDDTGAALTADLLVPALLVSMLARMRSLSAAVWAGMAVGVVERLIATNFDDRTLPD